MRGAKATPLLALGVILVASCGDGRAGSYTFKLTSSDCYVCQASGCEGPGTATHVVEFEGTVEDEAGSSFLANLNSVGTVTLEFEEDAFSGTVELKVNDCMPAVASYSGTCLNETQCKGTWQAPDPTPPGMHGEIVLERRADSGGSGSAPNDGGCPSGYPIDCGSYCCSGGSCCGGGCC